MERIRNELLYAQTQTVQHTCPICNSLITDTIPLRLDGKTYSYEDGKKALEMWEKKKLDIEKEVLEISGWLKINDIV